MSLPSCDGSAFPVKTRRGRLAVCLTAGFAFGLAAGCALPTATRTSTGAVGGGMVTAVYSRTSKDYVRARTPDGAFQIETYVLRNGGNFGGPRVDESIDKLSFEDVAQAISGPLGSQNYVRSDDPPNSRLLIVVYWGATVTPEDTNPDRDSESSQLTEKANSLDGTDPGQAAAYRATAAGFRPMEYRIQGQIDAKNANIMGYTDQISRTSPNDPLMGTLLAEIEQDRYYVVLLAYDYPLARKFGQRKLLWETRFSIPATQNDFEKSLPAMAMKASPFFGGDTHGLAHPDVADGHVEIGEPKSLGTVPEK
jgi:hypothetical protein